MADETALTHEEISALHRAKAANPYYFRALIEAVGIMEVRRNKYSMGKHPYYNFSDVARRVDLSTLAIFDVYRAMKASRAGVSSGVDFADESYKDSLIDDVNYSILKAGWVLAGLTDKEVLDGS